MRRMLLILIVLASVAGCATTAPGPLFTPHTDTREGEGVLYVFRPQAFALSVMTAVFDIDNRPVAHLENGDYAAIPLKAGRYTVRQSWKAGILGRSDLENRYSSIPVEVASGAASFVRLDAQMATIGPQPDFRSGIRLVEEREAREAIANCRRAELIGAASK